MHATVSAVHTATWRDLRPGWSARCPMMGAVSAMMRPLIATEIDSHVAADGEESSLPTVSVR